MLHENVHSFPDSARCSPVFFFLTLLLSSSASSSRREHSRQDLGSFSPLTQMSVMKRLVITTA